jgi:hypothetical protein
MAKKSLYIFILIAFLIPACAQVKLDSTAAPVAEHTASPTPTKIRATQTPIPTATQTAAPSSTPAPSVTITAVKGNLYIRRGPDMAYNPISVLYKDTTLEAHARDVMSTWLQVTIPKSDKMGWVSLQTEYSKVEGDVASLPQFKVTDWPVPSYVENCTLHKIYITPGNIYIDSAIFEPENLAWVYPGHYHVFDIDMPGDPVELDPIETKEGATIIIHEDGAGEYRKCPEQK